MSNKPKVLLTRRWPEAAEKRAADLFDATFNHDDRPMNVQELKQALVDYDAVCPTVTDQIDSDVLSVDSKRCRILGNFGVGYNHINLESAKKANIVVSNTPEVLTDCTADIGMTLLLMVARRAGEGERHVRSKSWTGWRPTHMLGTKLSGKTLGLVGMGRIACAMAHRAYFGFGMHIQYYDPFPPPAEVVNTFKAQASESLVDLVSKADFLSIHCPGGEKTRNLISAEMLSHMKPSSYLINTARGDVVDQNALIEALKNKRIRGAALDVYVGEPNVPDEFLSIENMVLLPHLGSATEETRVAMGYRAIDNVHAFFSEETVLDRVV